MLENGQISLIRGVGVLEVLLTSNSQANLGKIKPTISLHSWIPGLLNWDTLYHNSDAGEYCDDRSSHDEKPDDSDLDLVPYDAKKEKTDRNLANTNDHDSGHLAEHFILDRHVVGICTTDCIEQLS